VVWLDDKEHIPLTRLDWLMHALVIQGPFEKALEGLELEKDFNVSQQSPAWMNHDNLHCDCRCVIQISAWPGFSNPEDTTQGFATS
jgi:hypothetical protein